MNEFTQLVRNVWLSIRQNPYWVAFEGGASGAALSFIDDAAVAGHLDFSSAGLHKLGAAILVGGITAVRLLNRPSPGTNPNQQ